MEAKVRVVLLRARLFQIKQHPVLPKIRQNTF